MATPGILYWLKAATGDRKSTRLNSSHLGISYAVFCLKKKKDLTRRFCVSRVGRTSHSASPLARATLTAPPDLQQKANYHTPTGRYTPQPRVSLPSPSL